jgi:4-diphosphocytidyl-2C-methyl-D-erythritol kinase
MTGTGGTVFLPLSSYEDAKKVVSRLPKKEISLIVKSLDV